MMRTKEAINLFLKSRQAKGLSLQTLRWYKGILDAFVRQHDKLPRKPEAIEDFISSCTAGDERRHGYYRAIRTLYRFLQKRYGKSNPVDKFEPPKRTKKIPLALTPDQLDQLLRFPHQPKIKVALLFLADTGCRIGELSNLKPEDLSQTPWGYLAKVRGKTGERLVPISPEVYHGLLKYLPLPYSPFRLRRLVSQAFHNAHVPGSAHTLRHTFGTLWQGDELVLQVIMGHAYLSTTKIYRHLRTQTLSEQQHKYSPLRMVMSMSKEMNML